jgi:hypothetical protein
MIGSLTSQKRDLFPLDSFFFFCLFSLLTSHRVLYEYKKSDIHSLSPSLFSCVCRTLTRSLVRLRALPSFLLLYKNANMRMCKREGEREEKKTELVLFEFFSL